MTARSAATVQRDIDQLRRTSDSLQATLIVVAAGALVFTAVNVTRFAGQHDVPGAIGWLLDPLASLVLIGLLIAEGTLSRWQEITPGWVRVTKWAAGVFTWAMNIWSPVAAGDPGGLLVHSVAPALVILLAESAPRVRLVFAGIIDRLELDLAGMIRARTQTAERAEAGAVASYQRAAELEQATLAALQRVGARHGEAVALLAETTAVRSDAEVLRGEVAGVLDAAERDAEQARAERAVAAAARADRARIERENQAPAPQAKPSRRRAAATDVTTDQIQDQVRAMRDAGEDIPGKRTLAKLLTEHFQVSISDARADYAAKQVAAESAVNGVAVGVEH